MKRNAFTIVELLFVILIITVLVGILFPVIGKARLAARATETTALIVQLDSAIRAYHQDFGAYPGPLADNEINATYPPAAFAFAGFNLISSAPGFDTTKPTGQISAAENLVLALCGGLRIDTATNTLIYDPALVGKGPNNLNIGSPKHFDSYIDTPNLAWRIGPNGKTGQYQDDAGSAADSIIPEFVDTFSDPMPILYLRARVGAVQNGTPATNNNNGVIQLVAATGRTNTCQYQLDDIIAYTAPNGGKSIGVGRSVSQYKNWSSPIPDQHQHGLQTVNTSSVLVDDGSANYFYPHDAFAYFRNLSLSGAVPNIVPNIPRQKDAYILISAGKDRTYGTDDDITNFGAVMP